MKVGIQRITSAINKISDMTSGDKNIPGVLLDLSENLLKVCYSDGHKSLIEHLEVINDETDKLGAIAVDFDQLKRAIDDCQPSGSIKIDEIELIYKEKVLTIHADQILELKDEHGEIVGSKKMAEKNMDLVWKEPGSDMKSSILTRMKYDDIFNADITDEYDRKELLDALSRTSTEKGKQIYISTKTQTIFVANQAHVTSVPVSKLKTLNQEELDTLRASMVENGTFTDDNFKAEVAKAENRVHFAVVINQTLAKAIVGIFGKTNSDKLYLHTKDKFCNIFIDIPDETDENGKVVKAGEHVGIWFEMPGASKAHIGALERYNSLKFRSYQIRFRRDFLANNIKSALNASKSEKVSFVFKADEEDPSGKQSVLLLNAGSSQASVANTYRILPDDTVDPTGDLYTKTFTVSLSVFSAMLDQLKTNYVALDFDCSIEGTSCIRLAEINDEVLSTEYDKARQKTAELCKQNNIKFDSNSTPTPVEFKLEYRDRCLLTKQFTLLSK